MSYLDEGTYYVNLKTYSEDSICSDFKRVNNYMTITSDLEVNEIDNDFISIYPNPTSSMLNINLPETGTFDIEIIGEDGKVLFVSRSVSEVSGIDVSSLAPGHYTITVTSEESIFKTNFIKL